MIRFVIVCLIKTSLLFNFSAKASEQDLFLIAYIPHPQIESTYLPFFQSVYDELGIEIKYLSTGTKRGLLELNNGVLDADLLRGPSDILGFENIALVGPPIGMASISLVCKQEVHCSVDIFKDHRNTIAVNSANIDRIKREFSDDFYAKLYSFDIYDSFIPLLKAGRFNYAIFGVAKEQLSAEISLNFQVVPLYDIELYHAVNKRHSDKVQRLSEIIEKKLKLMKNR